MDDAYLGGQRSGGKRGRGAAGKTPIVATVETTAEGRPVRLKLRRMRGFRRTEIEAFAKRSLDVACTVVSDGLSCFRGVTAAGCTHQSAPARAAKPSSRLPSSGSTPLSATSRRRSSAPIGRSATSSPTLSGRVRVPLQLPLRSGRHAPPARRGCRAHPAHALPSPQIG